RGRLGAELEHRAAIGRNAERTRAGERRDGVGPGACRVDEHRGARLAGRTEREPPAGPLALGGFERRRDAQVDAASFAGREIMLVERGDVDIGAGGLGHGQSPFGPYPGHAPFDGRTADALDPDPAAGEGADERIDRRLVLRTRNTKCAARPKHAVLAKVCTRSERARNDRRAAVAFGPKSCGTAGRVVPGRVFALGQEHAGMRGELGRQACPGHPGTDHGNIVSGSHGGLMPSRNRSISSNALSRTTSTSRRISCAASVPNHSERTLGNRASAWWMARGETRRSAWVARMKTGTWTVSSKPGRISPRVESCALRTQPQLPGPIISSGRAPRHHNSSA